MFFLGFYKWLIIFIIRIFVSVKLFALRKLMPFSIGKFLLHIFQNPFGGFFNEPIELTDFCRFVANICLWKRALIVYTLL